MPISNMHRYIKYVWTSIGINESDCIHVISEPILSVCMFPFYICMRAHISHLLSEHPRTRHSHNCVTIDIQSIVK